MFGNFPTDSLVSSRDRNDSFLLSHVYIVIAVNPPSTVTIEPVTKLDASDASHRTAPINSSGFPKRRIGVCPKIFALRSRSMKCFLLHSVGKKPGRNALTLTWKGAHSRARFWVRFATPAFAAE